MSITNYSELQTAVANFTHRSDLAAVIPDFIRLAEDMIYGDIESRQQDISATLTCTPLVETLSLPSDFIDSLSLSVSSITPHGTIDFRVADQFRQEFQYGDSGVPRIYTIIGNNIFLAPIPDQAYTLNLIYQAKLMNLSNSNIANFLLTNYPSIYLYASLTHAAIYMEDDNLQKKWHDTYMGMLSQINGNDWANGNTMQVKTDVSLTQYRYQYMANEVAFYSPDTDPTIAGTLTNVTSLVPSMKGYKGAPAGVAGMLPALVSAAQGAATLKKIDNSTRFIAGTATKLYEASTSSWVDVSRISVYNIAADARWSFAQYGNASLAANKGDLLQFSTAGAFADVAAAPKAALVEVALNFAFVANTNEITYGDSPDRIWWSALGDYTTWTPSIATQAGTTRLTSRPAHEPLLTSSTTHHVT